MKWAGLLRSQQCFKLESMWCACRELADAAAHEACNLLAAWTYHGSKRAHECVAGFARLQAYAAAA